LDMQLAYKSLQKRQIANTIGQSLILSIENLDL
jgi:hypothetical protein